MTIDFKPLIASSGFFMQKINFCNFALCNKNSCTFV